MPRLPGGAQSPGNLVPFQINDNPGRASMRTKSPSYPMCPLVGSARRRSAGACGTEAPDYYCLERLRRHRRLIEGRGRQFARQQQPFGSLCIPDRYECVAIQATRKRYLDGKDRQGRRLRYRQMERKISRQWPCCSTPVTRLPARRGARLRPDHGRKQTSPRLITIVRKKTPNGGSPVPDHRIRRILSRWLRGRKRHRP